MWIQSFALIVITLAPFGTAQAQCQYAGVLKVPVEALLRKYPSPALPPGQQPPTLRICVTKLADTSVALFFPKSGDTLSTIRMSWPIAAASADVAFQALVARETTANGKAHYCTTADRVVHKEFPEWSPRGYQVHVVRLPPTVLTLEYQLGPTQCEQ